MNRKLTERRTDAEKPVRVLLGVFARPVNSVLRTRTPRVAAARREI
ncbi:MAG: hypothetical protein IPM22_11790 [Betaproteobacteria bacterium]|nr:hypothetical protein [Betaproteobacteria bacterium]MCC7217548.1 hypothetical protein [Burkholderiales bacterium]